MPLGLQEGKIFHICGIGITSIYTLLCIIINQEGKSGTGRNSESYNQLLNGPAVLCADSNLTQKPVKHVLFSHSNSLHYEVFKIVLISILFWPPNYRPRVICHGNSTLSSEIVMLPRDELPERKYPSKQTYA